jgi:hypothetical protein
LELLNWISDQLTMLAEAFAEPLTDERVEIYVRGLSDIPQEQLRVSFQRALRQLTWFPKLAELRNFAGANSEAENKVEADAAWKFVNDYLQRWGVDRLPIYAGGKQVTAPPLPPRIEYALRRIGGFRALNQMDLTKLPFMYRDFCEAYNLAPVAEQMAPRLQLQFEGSNALAPSTKESGKTAPLPSPAALMSPKDRT